MKHGNLGFPVGRIEREKANRASQRSCFDCATFFSVILVSFPSFVPPMMPRRICPIPLLDLFPCKSPHCTLRSVPRRRFCMTVYCVAHDSVRFEATVRVALRD